MKDRFFDACLLMIIGAVCASIALAGEVIHVFGARRQKGDVQLVYESIAWPKKLTGFHICRRLRGAGDSKWRRLTTAPLRPRRFDSIRWFDMGVDKKRAEAIRDWASALDVERGSLIWRLRNPRCFADVVGTDKGGMLMSSSYQRSWAEGDFRYALISGVGFVDDTAEAGIEYEYGLFEERKGAIGDKPLDTCYLHLSKDPKEIDLRFTSRPSVDDQTIQFRWQIEDSYCETFNFNACRVYRAEANNKLLDFSEIQTVLCFAWQGRGKLQDFSCTDRLGRAGGDTSKAYVYKIVPVTYFKEELPVSWRVEYQPKKEKDE